MKKFCNGCKINKDHSAFHKSKAQPDGLVSKCKSCKSQYRKKYYSKNKSKEYYSENKERKIELDKKYYLENKEAICRRKKMWTRKNRDRINRRHAERMKNDLQYRLNRAIRSRFNQAYRKGYKGGVAIQYLGCNLAYFKIYLENMFLNNMNWDNYGVNGWHIDHIKPLSSFDLENPEEVKIACHYTNLQPLWASDNLSKGAKI